MTELRMTSGSLELRGRPGSGATVTGYAAVFMTPYDLGPFREQVGPRAFNKTTRESDVRALFNHSPNFPLGRVSAGTLQLQVDDRGLRYSIDLPTNPMAQMVAEAIERRDVTGSSFAFTVVGAHGDRWEEPDERESKPLRTLLELRLFDVSVTTFPANEATEVDIARAARSLAQRMPTRPHDEIAAAIERGDLSPLWAPRGLGERVLKRRPFVPTF